MVVGAMRCAGEGEGTKVPVKGEGGTVAKLVDLVSHSARDPGWGTAHVWSLHIRPVNHIGFHLQYILKMCGYGG